MFPLNVDVLKSLSDEQQESVDALIRRYSQKRHNFYLDEQDVNLVHKRHHPWFYYNRNYGWVKFGCKYLSNFKQ